MGGSIWGDFVFGGSGSFARVDPLSLSRVLAFEFAV